MSFQLSAQAITAHTAITRMSVSRCSILPPQRGSLTASKWPTSRSIAMLRSPTFGGEDHPWLGNPPASGISCVAPGGGGRRPKRRPGSRPPPSWPRGLPPRRDPKLTPAVTRPPADHPIVDARGKGADRRPFRACRLLAVAGPGAAPLAGYSAGVDTRGRGAPTAEAIRYALNHRKGLERFLDDGRIEIDSNVVERAIRPVVLSRKNALFASGDDGGARWAAVASLVET